jgi:hypothetical protein
MNTNHGAIAAALAFAAVSCGPHVSSEDPPGGNAGTGGAGETSWTDPTTAADCKTSPLSYQAYSTEAELDALLVGRWRRCKAAQIAGEDVGVEFTADGNFYALTFNAAHEVVRQVGIDYGGQWTYTPNGSDNTMPGAPNFILGGVGTSAPQFTNNPRQLRVLFSPVLGIYVPLTP